MPNEPLDLDAIERECVKLMSHSPTLGIRQQLQVLRHLQALIAELRAARSRRYWCMTCQTFRSVVESGPDLVCAECSLIIATFDS